MTGQPNPEERWVTVMNAVERTVSSAPTNEPAVELPSHYGYILGLFGRSKLLYGAVCTLIRNHLAVEAGFQLRALFTESLWLQELAASDEPRRGGLILRYVLREGISDLEGIEQERHRINGESDSALSDALARQRKLIEEYAERNGYKMRAGFGSEKQLAQQHGRESDLLSFRYTHHLVHGSFVALIARNSRMPNGVLGVGADPGEDWTAMSAMFGATSALHSYRSACMLFGWDEAAETDDLFRAIAQVEADTGASIDRMTAEGV